MTVTVLSSVGPPAFGDGRPPFTRLELGRAPAGAPLCDDCRKPANLEVDTVALCSACLGERVRGVVDLRDEVGDLRRKVRRLEHFSG